MNLINEVERKQLNTIAENLAKSLIEQRDKLKNEKENISKEEEKSEIEKTIKEIEEKIEKVKDDFLNRDKNIMIGDLVKVYLKIVEGKKGRIQIFEGYVIAKKGSGLKRTIKVRKNSFGVGVEKTFFIFSPVIEKFEVIRHGKIRRAKLYYLRKTKGKKSQIKENILA